MKTFFLLLLNIAASAALLVLQPQVLGLTGFEAQGLFGVWLSTMQMLAVPVCLMVLNFHKSPLIRLSKLCWGLWLTLSSLAALATLNEGAPSATLFGAVFIASLVILGLSLTLFSTIELSRSPLLVKPQEKPAESNLPSGNPEETSLPKVEGL